MKLGDLINSPKCWCGNHTNRDDGVPICGECESKLRRPEDAADEARRLVFGDRHESYGPVEDSFAAVADIWTGLLRAKLRTDVRVSPRDVARLMVGLKLARETNRAKRDNAVDGHGYLFLHEQLPPE